MTLAADAAAYVDEWKAHRAATAVHGTSFSKVVGGFFLHTLGFQGHAQEFHTAVMSVQQLRTDYFRCGRPPALVSPSVAVQDAAAAPAAAALDRIHHVLLVPDACPWASRIMPAKTPCVFAFAVKTAGTVSKIRLGTCKDRRYCFQDSTWNL
tara:strand:- start:384 stop:839 length:456 start_codon:yes stop_codon:yes gene_type:complete